MGQTCSCDTCEEHQSPNATRYKRADQKSENEMNSATEYDTDYDTEETSSTSNNDSSPALTAKVISAVKQAITKGNDSLLMYLVQQYPDLDLFNIQFDNGDNCLQVAVKNSSYNLIYYLLAYGISVNLHQCPYTSVFEPH